MSKLSLENTYRCTLWYPNSFSYRNDDGVEGEGAVRPQAEPGRGPGHPKLVGAYFWLRQPPY